MEKSALYVVATPIGNLSDITLRALDVLKEVDYVLAEDTRITGRLLHHYSLKKQQISYRDQNSKRVIPKVLDLLSMGNTIALTSDSGTPLISDPGFKLVKAVIDAGYKVITVPGPSAVTAALSISGLPTDHFCFVGFLPRKGGDRLRIIKEYGELDATLIIYESPYRMKKTLGDISKVLGNRFVCVAKELTKVHEKTFSGYVDDVVVSIPEANIKGEFIILVAKKGFPSRI